MQRNKINYILRSGQSLPVSTPKNKITPETFPGLDKMRAKNARRRTLDTIKASGGYDRAKYAHYPFLSFSINKITFLLCYWMYSMVRFIPKRFEPCELKKVRLQEEMSGLKHQFSIENETNLDRVTSPPKDDDKEIDPVDECNIWKSIRNTWTSLLKLCPCILICCCSISIARDTRANGLVGGNGKIGWRSSLQTAY